VRNLVLERLAGNGAFSDHEKSYRESHHLPSGLFNRFWDVIEGEYEYVYVDDYCNLL
jgi:hypothetical protein